MPQKLKLALRNIEYCHRFTLLRHELVKLLLIDESIRPNALIETVEHNLLITKIHPLIAIEGEK